MNIYIGPIIYLQFLFIIVKYCGNNYLHKINNDSSIIINQQIKSLETDVYFIYLRSFHLPLWHQGGGL